MRKIFKLKGIEYYIVNADSIGEALVAALRNHWGVTEEHIEEVEDISENPVRIIRAFFSYEENQKMTWFRAKFTDGLRQRTYYLSSFYGSASDALTEGLGSWNIAWLEDIKELKTDGRNPGEWIESDISPLNPSKTKKLTDLILENHGNPDAPFAIVTNTKTGKWFRAEKCFVMTSHKNDFSEDITIIPKNIDDIIPVIGMPRLSDCSLKEELIGDNEKLHIEVFKADKVMELELFLYNVWISGINYETNEIVLSYDHSVEKC